IAIAHGCAVVCKEVKRHATRINQDVAEVSIRSHGYRRRGRRVDDKPHAADVLAGGVAGLLVTRPVVQWHAVVRDLETAIDALRRPEHAWQVGRERRIRLGHQWW